MSALSIPEGWTLDIGEEIGRGGCGVVHRGTLHRCSAGDEEVAVKMLWKGASDIQQRSFMKEIEKSQIISNRCNGVVKIYGLLRQANQACMVMKLYNGSLADRLAEDGKPPLKETLTIAAQIARALKAVVKNVPQRMTNRDHGKTKAHFMATMRVTVASAMRCCLAMGPKK